MAGGAPESSAVRRAEDGLDESSAEVVVLRGAMVRAVLRVASVGAGRREAIAATVWPEETAGMVLPVAMVRAVRREAIVATVWPGVTADFVTISLIHSVGSPERERGASHAAATMPTH
jgi:hypothetical protein